MTEPISWDLAERIAVRVAGREPFADSYHYASLEPDFAEFTSQAEELIARETGLRSLSGPARPRVTDRAGWVRANLASFRRLLRPLTEKLGKRMTTGPLTPVARAITGAEVGTMLGWMATRVLGQYDLLIAEQESPEEQDLVYYVGPNILALEKRYAFPPREFRLWLALLEGHGDITMNRAGAALIPSADRFQRVLHERRRTSGPARFLQKLVGIEAKLLQYELGERFIEAVEAAGGRPLFDLVWDAPELLPTLSEIREPETWMARVRTSAAAAQ